MDCAFGWQVLGDVTPLAAGTQDKHDTVEDFAHIDLALAPSTFRFRYQRRDMTPLLVRDIARVSQMIAIVGRAIFLRPHGGPSKSGRLLESQAIPGTQELSGRTLKTLHVALGAKGRLSFGSPALLLDLWGVTPGSVTPFGALNDRETRVQVALDAPMMACERLNFHPLINTATTNILSAELVRFLRATGHEPAIGRFSI